MLGYICAEHGYQSECDVSTDGERICYECGEWMRGVTGQTRDTTRSPPEGEPQKMSGFIDWTVSYGVSEQTTRVEAAGYIEAIEVAVNELDDPQEIHEVYPTVRRYRGQ